MFVFVGMAATKIQSSNINFMKKKEEDGEWRIGGEKTNNDLRTPLVRRHWITFKFDRSTKTTTCNSHFFEMQTTTKSPKSSFVYIIRKLPPFSPSKSPRYCFAGVVLGRSVPIFLPYHAIKSTLPLFC